MAATPIRFSPRTRRRVKSLELTLLRSVVGRSSYTRADNGVDERTTGVIYDKILAFSSFGFPQSHAAAMAVTAFQVAWLKYYYPAEFYCSLLNQQPMGFYSPEVIANDARRRQKVLAPLFVGSRQPTSIHQRQAPARYGRLDFLADKSE